MNISEFKKGDFIVRTKLVGNNENAYIGEKMIIIGIANGLIYFKRSKGNKELQIQECKFSEGWEYWVEPPTLDLPVEVKKEEIIDVEELKRDLQRAIDADNFELASEINKKIKQQTK